MTPELNPPQPRNGTEREKVFSFLTQLRDSGKINMFGAIPVVMKAFPQLSREEASNYFSDWVGEV